ncbi:MAG: IS200/IS605 family element RNA-guided endonuclease TnpB [Ktedonobacteraceae bacterium]
MQKRAYRYRFYPTDEQAHNLACTFGCVRFVYNYALNKRKRAYFDHHIKLSTKDLSAALTALKREEGTAWLKEVSSVPLQQALRHLDAAYTNFFEGRADYPTFKKKHHAQSATYTDNAFTLKGGKLTLAKQKEPLHIVWSRPLPEGAQPSSVTVSKDKSGRYFVSLLVEEGIGTFPFIDKAVGIDLGLKSFLIPSDGETLPNPKYYARDEKKLAKAQRKHARAKKGSKNRNKARKKVARLHARIADTRHDFQHKTSTKLIRENQVICLETLNVKGMLKNHKLAKAISDVGWGEFTRQLEYKATWHGRTIIKIDRWYPSSKTCSDCGHVLDTLTLDVREWVCPCCGAWHDRDINAARNILAAGLAVAACGGMVRPGDPRGQQAHTVEAGNLTRESGNPLAF